MITADGAADALQAAASDGASRFDVALRSPRESQRLLEGEKPRGPTEPRARQATESLKSGGSSAATHGADDCLGAASLLGDAVLEVGVSCSLLVGGSILLHALTTARN